MKKLAVLAVMATVLTIAGCSQSPQGTKNSIPDAQTSANATGTAVDAANGHVAAAASHTASAQGDVRAAIPLTTEPATGKLHSADSSLSQTQGELTAAKAELAKAQSENQKTEKALQDAQTERNKEENSLALETAKYDKLKNSTKWIGWLLWDYIVGVTVSLIVMVILASVLNYYTDIFVLPLKLFGNTVGAVLIAIIKGTYGAVVNIFKGVWSKLFKRVATDGSK